MLPARQDRYLRVVGNPDTIRSLLARVKYDPTLPDVEIFVTVKHRAVPENELVLRGSRRELELGPKSFRLDSDAFIPYRQLAEPHELRQAPSLRAKCHGIGNKFAVCGRNFTDCVLSLSYFHIGPGGSVSP